MSNRCEDDILPQVAQLAAMQRKKLGKKNHSDGPESDESDVSCSGDDDSSEDGDYDVGPYLYLKGTMHYDSEDNCVYKCADVVPEDFGDGAVVLVYRTKYDAVAKSWLEVDKENPVHVASVIQYHEEKDSKKKMNAIMQPPKDKTTKGKRRGKNG